MEEAKFSLNFKFNYQGYDSQLTLRSDENPGDLIGQFNRLLLNLQTAGAVPERRWENGKGKENGKAHPVPKPGKAEEKPAPQPAPAAHPVPKPGKAEEKPQAAPVCPVHGISAPSKYGGLYCPTKDEDGNWCPWRSRDDQE